jgi:hypothetical protein
LKCLDDLFEEEPDKPLKPAKKDSKEISTRKYVEQNWKLNEKDTNEFQGISKSNEGKGKATVRNLPLFALMYKIRKEYFEVGTEGILAQHKGHSEKFPRMANNQFIKMEDAKGIVTLFIGQNEKDIEGTRQEIMQFLETDPLIEKDMIETWDLIDLTEQGKGASIDLPLAVP